MVRCIPFPMISTPEGQECSTRKESTVKSRMLRVASIAAAVLIPAGGFVALGSSTAGATTKSTKITPHFTFTTSNGTNTLTCTKETATMTSSTGSMWQIKTPGVQFPCTSSGKTRQGTGIGAATSIAFLLTATGLLVTFGSPLTAKLKNPHFSIKLKFGSGSSTTCTITFGTISLSQPSGETKVLQTGTITTSGATVTGTLSVCSSIRTLLHSSGSTFHGTLTASSVAWTAL